MKYDKIIKWVLVALFAIGALLSVLGFAIGFDANGDAPVDIMLYCDQSVCIGAVEHDVNTASLRVGVVADIFEICQMLFTGCSSIYPLVPIGSN